MAGGDARRILWGITAAAVLVIVGVAFQQRFRAAEALESADSGPVNDFDRWMIMTPHFVRDHADYVDDNFPTPPLTLMAFAPFAALLRPDAQFAWACAKLPLICLVFLLTLAMVARSGAPLTRDAILLVAAGWWLPVIVDLQEGQVNFLALAPLVGALIVAQQETDRSDVAAGFLIGLSVSIKLTPIAFVAYFLWKRRWILAGSAAASIVFWSLLVPSAVFGWQQNLRWLEQWTAIMVVPYASTGRVAYSTTQSVGSFAMRLLTAAPAFEVHRHRIDEYGYMNVAALSGASIQLAVRMLMVGVAVAGLAWMRRPLATLRSQRYVLEIAAVAAFMLWFSERTWVHHYVAFVLTLAAAGMVLGDPAVPETARRSVRRSLIAFSCLTCFSSEAGRVLGPHGVEWAKALGVFLWPSVAVAVAALRAAGAARPRLETSRPLCYEYASRMKSREF
jgi:alpha-1,2-mannosyltransferase